MNSQRTILLCDNNSAEIKDIESALANAGYDVDIIEDAAALIPKAIRFHPSVILVNPEMVGFNEYDVCKNIMKAMGIPLILLLDPHSARRTGVGDCEADDVITYPVNTDNLVNLVSKLCAVNQ